MARIRKGEAARCLADVPDEFVFRCQDACVFRNMRELRDGLASMTEELYAYHANAEKNDFSNWVRDVIKDEKLAGDLQNSKSKAEAANRVATRIMALGRPQRALVARHDTTF